MEMGLTTAEDPALHDAEGVIASLNQQNETGVIHESPLRRIISNNPKETNPMSEKIFIFDTTLRDAEQTPGAALNLEEKLEIAKHLAKLNVDIIEAGFPVSSPGDFEAVKRISNEVIGPEICALSRVVEKDITAAWNAIKDAPRPRIHTFVGTSDIHIVGITRSDRQTILKRAVDAVAYAKSLCAGHPHAKVEFSPMDASRTEPGYLYEVIEATINAGATIINIPDTVGYAIPSEFGQLIANIFANVPNIGKATVSVHCHDDLGLAVANSIAAIKNGARQVECTVNGLGERAGNTSMEEIVMAIRTRHDHFKDFYTDINTKEIVPISRRVSRTMGMLIAPNKAIVGANAFAHSSGIHQDGVIKERLTFEIIAPEDVGLKESQIILSPRSGRNALRHRLNALGYEVTREQLDKIYERFIAVADKKKEVHDADLEAIMKDEVRSIPEVFQLEYIQVVSGTRITPTTTVGVRTEDGIIEEAATGDGPVDAAYRAIDRITKIPLRLTDYSIRSVTEGKDAIGEVTIKAQDNGHLIVGHGASTDIIEASAKAYIDAINKVVHLRHEE
ncbi:2-isopropylmalate synthase [Candidatus Poribacteria bacterium]|nr:2-isopropylmalate synthase [Candidatus Poribacteria bacterium]